MRVLAVLAAWLLWTTAAARADTVETAVKQLASGGSYRVRLAAALALSKSRDPRAVIALADALTRDDEATVRRVSALALAKTVDARTPEDARELALEALDHASAQDAEPKVRETAAKALKSMSGLRRLRKPAAREPQPEPSGDKPEVFVNIDVTTDQSHQLSVEAGDRLTRAVRRSVERTGYATSWPGGLPTAAQLTSNRSRAFIVASTVKKIEITKGGRQTQIACTVAIRIAPWGGSDGGERWEANKAASASGSAKAMTGNNEREIQGGVRDCVEAVGEDVTARQVVPFLKRLAQAGS